MNIHERGAGFFAALVRRPVMLFTLCLTLVLVGILAWTRIPIQMMPDGIVEPGLQIWVQNIGGSAPENEEQVARVLEEDLRSLAGVEDIDSRARNDSVSLEVSFRADMDMNLAKAEVRDRVERARPKLPKTVSQIGIWSWNQSDMPAMFFALMHPGDSARTDFLVQEVIQRRLEAVDGVGKVEVWGLLDDSRRILLDEQKVKAARLDLGALIKRLQADNFALPMGEVEDGGRRIMLRADMRFRSSEEIAAYPIGSGLTLGDVGHVEDVKTVRDNLFRIDGRYAYFGEIRKDGQANVVATCKRLQTALAELEKDPQLRGEFQFLPIFDQGAFIQTSLEELMKTALVGGLLSILILFVFLWRVRLTLMVAAAIPLSLVFTIAWTFFRGGTFNILTMTGITLAMGMLVDNAIVVIENITRLRADGCTPRDSVVRGASDVALAVALSTLTTVVVFMPMIFMTENPILRLMFGELGIPLCVALVFSLIVSLVFLPVAAEHLLGDRPRWVQAIADRLRPLGELPARALGLFFGLLRRALLLVLALLHRLERGLLAVLTPLRWPLALGLLALAFWAARPLSDLVRGAGAPAALADDGSLSLGASLPVLYGLAALAGACLLVFGLPRWRARPGVPPGTAAAPGGEPPVRSIVDGLVRANGMLTSWSIRHRLAATLLSLAVVFSFLYPLNHMTVAAFGQDQAKTRLYFSVQLEDNFTLAQASEEMARYEKLLEPRRERYGFDHLAARFSRTGGQIRMFFEHAQKEKHLNEITAELRRDLPRFPGHKLRFTDDEGSTRTPQKSELVFSLQGPDSDELARLAPQAVALLQGVNGLGGVSAPDDGDRRQVQLSIDSDVAQRLGVSARTALENVSWALAGFQLPPFQEPGRELPLIIEYDSAQAAGLDTLRDLQIFNGSSMVPLTSFTNMGFAPGQRTIYRHNGQATLNLRARITNPAQSQELYAAGVRALQGLELPRGYAVASEDSLIQRQENELNTLKAALLLAFVLVFIVMAITFESFFLPFAIICTVPLYAGVGAYWTLYLTGTAMDSVGWIGIIILVGVAVNNGIVLIDRIQQLRREGWERAQAIVEGAKNRVRPILMTTLTSVLGLIPLAVSEPPGESIDYRALATCIAGGLAFSTVLTLWVLPLAYTLLDDFQLALKAHLSWGLRRKAAGVAAGPEGETGLAREAR